MFDYIKCEFPLPDDEASPPPAGTIFQTKDTPEQGLVTYTIEKDGTFSVVEFDYETVPEEERPYHGRGGIFDLIGSLRTTNERRVVLDDYHGDVEFYTSVKTDAGYEYWTYVARFTDGKCVKIKLIEHPKTAARGEPAPIDGDTDEGQEESSKKS